jgi:D-sedoheptulose 7-phosphate isomerase
MSYFPNHGYADAGRYASDYFEVYARGAASVSRENLAAAGIVLAERAGAGNMIFSCGNGGSAAIANHLVCDCLKGVRSNTELKPRVQSLSATIELVTAIVNDIGVEEMFSFQLESLASNGDVLIAISSSGASPNIIRALKWAKANGMATIAMTGFTGGEAAKLADISLHVAIDNYGVVEDLHQSFMHILAQYLRQAHLNDPSLLGSIKF